jgi:SAM-dependent methyltransferase
MVDFEGKWPFKDGEFDEVRAWDFPQRVKDRAHFMNEAWRVLKEGGHLDMVVPSADSPLAFQDPTYESFWNSNSFYYYSVDHPEYLALYPEKIKCAFKIRLAPTDPDKTGGFQVKMVGKKVPYPELSTSASSPS